MAFVKAVCTPCVGVVGNSGALRRTIVAIVVAVAVVVVVVGDGWVGWSQDRIWDDSCSCVHNRLVVGVYVDAKWLDCSQVEEGLMGDQFD